VKILAAVVGYLAFALVLGSLIGRRLKHVQRWYG